MNSKFDGPKQLERVEMLCQTTAADNHIEPIPYGQREWHTNQDRPILEIARREGLVVTS